MHADPRHRNLLRRNLGGRRRGNRRRGAPVGDPIERRRVAGAHSSRVGRRRAGARLAPAHPRHLRRRRARPRRGRRHLVRSRRRRRDARAGARRIAARRRLVREGRRGRRGLPLVAVHHLAGHIESLVLQNGELPLPSVVLVVSGGHTSLYLVDRPGPLSAAEPDARRCGGRGVRQGREAARPRLSRRPGDRSPRAQRQRSRDRAADDAADARGSERAGVEGRSRFQLQRLEDRRPALRERQEGDGDRCRTSEIADVCASFQRVVVTALLDRLFDAARRHQAKSIGIAGGVSANSRLRAELDARGGRRELPVFLPSLALSTDNAAMIAAAGLRKFREGVARAGRSQRRRGARAMTVFTR